MRGRSACYSPPRPPPLTGGGKSFVWTRDWQSKVSRLFIHCDIFRTVTIGWRWYPVMGTVVRMTKMVSSVCPQVS